MKILLDACAIGGDLLFCCADEDALCGTCDCRGPPGEQGRRRAPPLPPLLPFPPALQHLLGGFLLGYEDRAILCNECDASIHVANRICMGHNRFILAGVRPSAAHSPGPEPQPQAQDSTRTAVSMSQQNKALLADASSPTASISCSTTGSCAAAAIPAMPDFTMGISLLPFPEPGGGGLEAAANKLPTRELQVPLLSSASLCLPAVASTTGKRSRRQRSSRGARTCS